MKNFHCFTAFKRRNVNELLPGLHIWWKQLQHSLYTFCILSVVCVYQWLPVCFEQTKPFLEIVHNSRKCIFSTTKKLEMHIQIQRNLSMIIYQALMVIRIEFHIVRFCKRRGIYLTHYIALFKLMFLFSVPFQVQTFMVWAKVSSLKCAVFYLYMACTYLCSCIHYNLHKKQMSFC